MSSERHDAAGSGMPRISAASPAVAEMLARVADPQAWTRWARQVEHTGHCVRPVRLYGRAYAVDAATGEIRAEYSSINEPDGTLLVACKDRRAAVCPSCARTYRADTWHLVAAGLRGRQAPDMQAAQEPPNVREMAAAAVPAPVVPASVVSHPVVFATFTAPSFGPVHRVAPQGRACRPRRGTPTCAHGAPLWCGESHSPDDPAVGAPLCAGCYDHLGHVLWHAYVPQLWRRTSVYLYRALAGGASRRGGAPVSVRGVRDLLRISYVKVAEWQRRAAIHFHAVLRLDGVDPEDPSAIIAPPIWADTSLLEEAIRAAVSRAAAPLPGVGQPRRWAVWGSQLDITEVTVPERAAAYVAKYATKTAGDTLPGLPASRFVPGDLAVLRAKMSPHVTRLVAVCFELDRRAECAGLGLAVHAHTLGFSGHFVTKTRHYSTTLGALRAARRTWRAHNIEETAADPWARAGSVIVGDWRLVGVGYARPGDVELAATLTREHAEARDHVRIVTQAGEGGTP